MKKILIILSIFIILAAGIGGIVYNSYKKGPLYSLKQAGLAIKDNNPILMEKYIDIDSLAGKMIDEQLSEAPEMASNPFAVGLASMMKPALIATVKTSFLSAVQSKAEEAQKTGSPTKYLKSVKVLNKDNTAATVELILYGKDNDDLKLVLAMQKKGDYWQVKYLLNSKDIYSAMEKTTK
ncbi:MAG: hypothetical protein ACI351_01895 [Candidatus Avelusimicrobium sp.]|uniref:hypothetical protein n=1 Tax=Candidatus Avelusimicrobium sp. TaxID=3048833 RepID=UPI003EFF713B